MKKNTRKRKNHRRKTYKGGILESNKTYCNKKEPIEEFKQLYDVVDTKKYSRGFTTYSGGGCDLFIWVKKEKDPHIHVHGFTDNRFFYTITGLGVRNNQVELPSRTGEGYKYVLDEMCARLTIGKHTPTSKVYDTPERSVSTVELRSTKPRPPKLGLGSDIFKDVSIRLSPMMGKKIKDREIKDREITEKE
jgi:hypothetical protein